MDIVDPRVETYMRSLLDRYNERVLLEMEAEAEANGFPIVGRTVGVTLEVLALTVGARRVCELGSGFGYSAYWFSRAVGPDGEVQCTDGDPANEPKALAYLTRSQRVLYVPTTEGFSLLLSATEPERLLEALRRRAGS